MARMILAFLAGFFYAKNSDKINQKVKDTYRDLKSKADDLIGSNKKSMDE